MPEYRIQRFRGKFAIVFWADGKRQRHTLATADPRQAEYAAPSLYAELTRPKGNSVDELWQAYCRDKAGHAVLATMRHTWKALHDRFGIVPGDSITIADCRAHCEERRRRGIKDGTIHTELGHLRTVLRHAERHGLISCAPYIERPSKPRPKEAHLTRTQARLLRDAAGSPHVRLYIVLAQTTGARNAALLDLTWSRVDFISGQIDLRNPELTAPHKGRAIVPMNRDARAALQEAHRGRRSDYVIEWAGRKVKSVKRGLQRAAKNAGLGHVSPHMLRRSAAIHMAEDGVPLGEISQFLGHSDMRITERAYARFQPTYLQRAAAALEYDDLSDAARKRG